MTLEPVMSHSEYKLNFRALGAPKGGGKRKVASAGLEQEGWMWRSGEALGMEGDCGSFIEILNFLLCFLFQN